MSGSARIVITGAGVISAAGCSLAAVGERLARGQHCLSPISHFETTDMSGTHGGEVHDFAPLDFLPPGRVSTLDRGTQMALAAATQALAQAGLPDSWLETAGVAVGYSGSPQYQNMPVYPDQRYPATRRSALYAARTTPNFQADQVARAFGLGGPRFAFGSASLGGLLALAHAVELLGGGHAQAMLVGGGEINTLLNALGMDGLGIVAAGPCTPFTGRGGISFGDGAAFFVLERLDDARGRGALPLAELLASGISADAYSDVAQDPSGRGLARAIRKCLDKSGVAPAGIGWVRSCGTGARDLDAAEAIALHEVFDGAPPPVTSTEPYFSHVNGVSPLLGLAAVIAAFATGRAPGMPVDPEAESPRPGLSLPFVSAGRLPAGDCLLTATAFGGSNGALIVRCPPTRTPALRAALVTGWNWGQARLRRRPASAPRSAEARVVIAGMGAVSALGGTAESLLQGFSRQAGGEPEGGAMRVEELSLRRRIPGIDLRRRARLIRLVMLAVGEALDQAGISARGSPRYGLLVGLSRGPVAASEKFFGQTLRGRFDVTTGRALLRIGRFSVASEVAHDFGLQGYSGCLAPGVHGGVQLLAHGAELLRASPDLDGLLVVAADEWTGIQEIMYHRLGLLGDGAAYDRQATGCIGGEGAAALLLCRRAPDARAANDWAAISGTGFAGDTGLVPDRAGRAYHRAIAGAVDRAGLGEAHIDFAVGQGCGWTAYDEREVAGLAALNQPTARSAALKPRLTSAVPHTGLAETAGGLFAAMAAAGALRGRRLPAIAGGRAPANTVRLVGESDVADDFHHGLVIGSTERGAHAAVVLTRLAA
jgi:3-oxoacyl-[acyl-carrier-protein] synthase II